MFHQEEMNYSTAIPKLVSGGETPGDRLPRIPGTRPGEAGYYQDLENWTDISCFSRLTNYTIDKMAIHKYPNGNCRGAVFVLRNAENHVPLLLIYIDEQQYISVANLVGTHTLLSANNGLSSDFPSVVIEAGYRKIGEVAPNFIFDDLGERTHIIEKIPNLPNASNYRCKSLHSQNPMSNNFSVLHEQRRILVQLGENNSTHTTRALVIIAAIKCYHHLENEFQNPNFVTLFQNDIHPTLYDLVCQVPILRQIEIPSYCDTNSMQVDENESQLMTVTDGIGSLQL